MELINSSMLKALSIEKKRQFEELLPQIVKKLIKAGEIGLDSLRIPSGDDIQLSGYDGIVQCNLGNEYVAKGQSVWEFGTSRNLLNKINSDYEKRTENSLGIEKKETTFYLVTSQNWECKISKSEWETNHTDWKAVRVYDATVLCDWINGEPTVASWLLETIFGRETDFYTIDKAWDLFSQKTNPGFIDELFINSREQEVTCLYAKLNQPFIKVKADSTIEAVGFVLSALRKSQENEDKCIVVNNYTTYKAISEYVKNKIIVINFVLSGDIIPSENCTILCYNKEATSIKPDIQLKPYSKMHFINCFKTMGLDSGKADELYAFCHGNYRALIRRIPGIAQEKAPEWAQHKDKELLKPIVFLRSINMEYDKELIEQITEKPIKTVADYYRSLIQKEDSPVKMVEDYYNIVNYEEAWNTLGFSVEDGSFEDYHAFVRWFFDIISQEGRYSKRLGQMDLVNQRTHNLLLNYVYYVFSSNNLDKLKQSVRELISLYSSGKASELLFANFSILAEAAPQEVFDYIAEDLNRDNSEILSLFMLKGYFRKYGSILATLEELTQYNKTAVKACKTLFDLYRKEFKSEVHCAVEDSLLNVLCLISEDTALTLTQKKDLISSFYREDAYRASILSCGLLGKTSYYKSNRYGERHNNANNEYTIRELMCASEHIANSVFEYCNENGNVLMLQSLLKQYHFVRPVFLEEILGQLSVERFRNQDLTPIIFQLKERIWSITKYQLSNEEAYIPVLKRWDDVLSLACPQEERDDWMFYKVYTFPSEALLRYKDDIYAEKEKERQIRTEKLREIYSRQGMNGIIRLANRMEDDGYWGNLLSNVVAAENTRALVETLVGGYKYALLGGLIDGVCEKVAKRLYSELSDESKIRVLSHIKREIFWQFLKTPEEKKRYWEHIDMLTFDYDIYSQLLEYNPKGLLRYYYGEVKKKLSLDYRRAREVIRAIADCTVEDQNRSNHDEYFISEIVNKIDSVFYSEEWAKTTIKLYEKSIVKKMPTSGKEFFFQNPYEFVEYVSRDSSTYYRELWNFTLPKSSCERFDELTLFVKCLIDNNYTSLAGNIIGRLPRADDRIGLHANVQDLLEHMNDTKLDDAVVIGIYNDMGFRSISDGTDMKEKAKAFEEKAAELEALFPHSARILRSISQQYYEEGRNDHVLSEVISY